MKAFRALAVGILGISCFCFSTFAEEYPSEFIDSIGPAEKSTSSPITEIADIYFVNPGFYAQIFYNNIRGADGISVKSMNHLRVVNEFGPDGPIVLLTERGGAYSTDDALSTIGAPLVSPDDIEAGKGKRLYVADGQAQTVFMLPHTGGIPVPFVTPSTTGSDWFNPFGVEIAPPTFDGPNVDPGDVIVADNGFGLPDRHTVWAVNQQTGVARKIAQGTVFEGGPLRVEFGPDGTLYVSENFGPSGMTRISTVTADGTVSRFVEHIAGRGPIAVHPKTGDLYFTYANGMLFRKPADGGAQELFAYNLGWFQGIEFSNSGSSLFVSAGGREQIIEILGNTQAWRGIDTIVNGNFETGDLIGWTASGINDGFAVVVQEGTCFSWNNTLGLTFNGSFVAIVRSSTPAPTNSVGILTSDLFEARSGISFRALSENADAVPVPDPVTLEVRVLDAADVVLLSQVVTTNIVTLDGPCPRGELRDGIFSTHFVDTSAYSGNVVRVEFRQHTNVAGFGFFTLIDDVNVTR